MKHLGRTCVILFAIVCAACAGPDTRPNDQQPHAVARDNSREILLTFPDRGLRKTPNMAPGRYHGRTSDYRTTTWSRTLSSEIARDYSLDMFAEWPIRALGVHCVVYLVEASRSIEALMARLRSDERVESVQRMNTFRTLSEEDPYKSLQTAFSAMQVEPVHSWSTGKDISIAIIDTGVDVRHPDLAGQVKEQADLTDIASSFSDDIHGTAVAGIIGALSGNGQGITGVAPDARLFALRACWPEEPGEIAAVCNSLTLAKALDTAIFLKPRIVNLSLTGPQDPLIEALLGSALRKGIIIVAALPDQQEPVDFASRVEGLIRVRSSREEEIAGAKASTGGRTVSAPGDDVLTTFPNGTYNFASGSSFAAANVSGVIALLLELQPGLTANQAWQLLTDGTEETTGKSDASLSSHLNACEVVTRLLPDITCKVSTHSKMMQKARIAGSFVQ